MGNCCKRNHAKLEDIHIRTPVYDDVVYDDYTTHDLNYSPYAYVKPIKNKRS